MVYFKPVLAGAVALTTFISTTSALPASIKRDQAASSNISNNISANGKRSDGPVVVQAKSAKRGYVGGGHAKGLKQAPLVKSAKLVKAKRDIVEP